MMEADLTKPSTRTGFKRAVHELTVGISAAKAFEEMQAAMLAHACRVTVSRFLLDFGHTLRIGTGGACGGVIGKVDA